MREFRLTLETSKEADYPSTKSAGPIRKVVLNEEFKWSCCLGEGNMVPRQHLFGFVKVEALWLDTQRNLASSQIILKWYVLC